MDLPPNPGEIGLIHQKIPGNLDGSATKSRRCWKRQELEYFPLESCTSPRNSWSSEPPCSCNSRFQLGKITPRAWKQSGTNTESPRSSWIQLQKENSHAQHPPLAIWIRFFFLEFLLQHIPGDFFFFSPSWPHKLLLLPVSLCLIPVFPAYLWNHHTIDFLTAALTFRISQNPAFFLPFFFFPQIFFFPTDFSPRALAVPAKVTQGIVVDF